MFTKIANTIRREQLLQEMKGQAAQLSIRELIKVVRLFNQAGLDLKTSAQSQLPLELAFVDAALDEEEKVAPPVTHPGSGTVPKPGWVCTSLHPS